MSRITWILGLLLIVFGGHPNALSAQQDEFLTGLRSPTEAEQLWLEQNAITLSGLADQRSPLPAKVSNVEFLPHVARQTLPNCGAFAPTYYLKTYLEARKRGWGKVSWLQSDRAVSPGIAYAFGLVSDAGASIPGTISLMTEIGSLPLSRLPDTDNYSRSTFPPLRLFLEAMPFQGMDAIDFERQDGFLTEGGFLALKEWLAAGEIAVFGISISDAIFDYGRVAEVPGVHNDVIYAVGGPPRPGGHALTVIGYDDDKAYVDSDGIVKHGAFLVVNSWGTNWGIVEPSVGTAGFAWFGYEYFRTNARSVMSMTLRDEHEPDLIAVIALDHPKAYEMPTSVFGGARGGDAAWANGISRAPSMQTPYDPRYPLALNATSPDGEPSESYWWVVTNYFNSVPPGTAEVFRIYRYDDVLAQLPERLYTQQGADGPLVWNLTSLDQIDAVYLDGPGLPAQAGTPIHPTLVNIGLFGEGESIVNNPTAWGSLIFADLNGSGLQDLISLGNPTEVYENRGSYFRRVDAHGLPNVDRAAGAAGDFDRDGLPDIAIVGAIDVFQRITHVYRNKGNFEFEKISANLPGVSGSDLGNWPSVAWGDFDNDGLEDLAVWGNGPEGRRVYLFRNLGDGNFGTAEFPAPVNKGGLLAWHDVNGNGWLDLTAGPYVYFNRNGTLDPEPGGENIPVSGNVWQLASGIWADFAGNGLVDFFRLEVLQSPLRYKARLIHNLGNEQFQDSGVFLRDVRFARMAAADYNNNGRLDLASTHLTQTSGPIGALSTRKTAIFRQSETGSFHDAGFDMEGLVDGDIAFSDVNGDGALDLVATGEIRTFDDSRVAATSLYRSRIADAPLFANPNTPPTPPVDLQAEHDPVLDQTIFSWSHGTDEQTPQAALAYNVRVGTLPGLGDIYSEASSAPITTTTRIYRIAPDQPGMRLHGLKPGFYYWSVRTVDGGHMASGWTAPELLVVEGFDPRDVNRDGVFDVADLVKFAALLDDHRDLIPLEFDFNQDGTINQSDLRALARLLVGSSQAFPGAHTIDSSGGTVVQDGVELKIPPGTLLPGATAVLTIERVDAREGFAGVDGADGYRISGLPLATLGEIEILLDPVENVTGTPVVFIGHDVWAKGAISQGVRYQTQPAQMMPDGRLRIIIPPLPETDLDETVADGLEGADGSYFVDVGVLNNYVSMISESRADLSEYSPIGRSDVSYSNARFSISYPNTIPRSQITNVMQGLDMAYEQLKTTHGFSYDRRTRWPIHVSIRDLGEDEDGAQVSTVWGLNYMTIEINSQILADLDRSRATAAHEFFHVVQGLYDPRNRLARVLPGAYLHYWLDEAMSTWVESLVVSSPGSWIPSTYERNMHAPLQGIVTGFDGAEKVVEAYGYGMAPLIKYLVNRVDGALVPVRIYERIYARRDPVQALAEGVAATDPGTPFFTWYTRFFEELILQNIYDLGFGALSSLVPSERRLILGPGRPDNILHVPVTTTDLSAALHLAGFTTHHEDPGSDAVFMLRFDGDPGHAVQVFKASNQSGPELIDTLLDPVPARFLMIEDARSTWAQSERIFVLVSDPSRVPPYDTERDATLTLGLAEKGPFELPSNTVTGKSFGNRDFPVFSGQGQIRTVAISDFDLTSGELFLHGRGVLWGAESVEFEIDYQSEITGPLEITYLDSLGREVTLTTTPVQGYKLYMQVGEDFLNDPVEEFYSDTGLFHMSIDLGNREHGERVNINIRALYTVTITEDGSVSNVIDAEWPVAIFQFGLP